MMKAATVRLSVSSQACKLQSCALYSIGRSGDLEGRVKSKVTIVMYLQPQLGYLEPHLLSPLILEADPHKFGRQQMHPPTRKGSLGALG